MLKGLEATSKVLICSSGVISLVLAVAGRLIIRDDARYAGSYEYMSIVGGNAGFLPGVALGYILAVIKIALIDRSCKKALEMEADTAKLYMSACYFTRLLLTGVFLFAAISIPAISFLGVLLGAFSLQLAGYALPAVERRLRSGR